MKHFNLSEWALEHRAFTGFVMVLLLLGGIFAYFTLEQREDPKFTFRLMVVKTLYPGATALEVENQVTDRLEKKLQELPNLDYVRSYSKPGESVIFVTPREDIPATEIAYLWYQVRKKIADIKLSMPPGVIGPFFNDEFGDTYSLLYAFSGEGFSYAELKDIVDSARQQILRVKDVEKVDLIGVQDEKIYVEFSDKKLAELGLDVASVAQVLQAQNGMVPAGTVITPQQNLPIRLTGSFDSVASVANLPIRLEGRTFRVSDFAKVTRGYVDPAEFKMRFNGKDVIGLGVTMSKKGDVLALGKLLEGTMASSKETYLLALMLRKWPTNPRWPYRYRRIFAYFLGSVGGGAVGEFFKPWHACRFGRRPDSADCAGRNIALYVAVRFGNSSYLFGCAHPRLGIAGGRCHDCH